MTSDWETSASHIVISSEARNLCHSRSDGQCLELPNGKPAPRRLSGIALFILRGASIFFMRRTTISHFSFTQGFQIESKDGTPHWLTLPPITTITKGPSMSYLFQFGMILAISFVGELLHALLPLPVPASIYGILILFALLYFKVIRIPQIRQASMFLIEIMPILFLPAAVGLMDSWHLISSTLLQYIVIIILAMVIVMAAGGLFTQFIMKKVTRKETCHE